MRTDFTYFVSVFNPGLSATEKFIEPGQVVCFHEVQNDLVGVTRGLGVFKLLK